MAMHERDPEQEQRIERLKAQAAAAAEGPMVAGESEDLPADVREEFWREVAAFETEGTTNLLTELKAIGVDPPHPDGLDDEAVHAALWSIVQGLARLRVVLERTDHLSDRELYTRLFVEELPDEMPALDKDGRSWWHVDLVGRGSLDDMMLNLKYYADEEMRSDWRKDFPECEVPPHEDLPFDRDSRLPVDPGWG